MAASYAHIGMRQAERNQLDENLSLEVYRVAHRMTRALRRSGLRCEGVNLFLADGQAAFQEVPHVNMHVFPRYHGDSFRIDADWRPRDRTELDTTAARLQAGLQAVEAQLRPAGQG
jgi:histidine triad (HIT) family protein